MFDELNNLDNENILALDNLIHQKENIARIYNRRVQEKVFGIGELVLKVILLIDKKSRVYGKWSPNWEGLFK